MRVRSAWFTALLAAVAFASAVVPQAASALVLEMDLPQLSRAADAIVVATVVKGSSRDANAGSGRAPSPVTDTSLRVTRIIAGSRGDALRITQSGGVVDGLGLRVPDLPQFSPGERCVLFLSREGFVVGAFQGKMAIVDGRVANLGITVTELERRVRLYRAGVDPLSSLAAPLASVSGLALEPQVAQSDVAEVTAASMSIASVTPTKQIAGMDRTVTISGNGFGASQGTGRVQFVHGLSVAVAYATNAPVLSWSDTSITVRVPANASSGPLRVTTGSNSVATFEYDTSFSTTGMRFPANPVAYRINENTADMFGEGAEIRKAFDTWNAVADSRFQLSYAGTSTRTESQGVGNGINEMWFTPSAPGSGMLAVNYLWYYEGRKDYIESDILFDDTYLWATTASSTALDVQSVALHELGHTVGLDDQYPNTWRVMGAGVRGQNRRALSVDDRAGAVFLYGVEAAPGPPPVTSSTHPSQDTWYRATSASMSFRSESEVAGYSYVIDISPSTEPDLEIDTTSSSLAFTVPQGVRWFHVRAVSASGQGGETAHYRLRSDVTPPTGTVSIGPLGSHFTSSTAVPVVAALSDAHSGLLWMRFDPGTGLSTPTVFAAGASVTLPSRDGSHTVTAEYWDAASNVLRVSRTLVVDRVAPVTSSHIATVPMGISVSLLATDDRSGAASTWYRLNGGAQVPYTGPFTLAGVGTHVLRFHSVDAVGNLETAKTTTITASPPAPGESSSLVMGSAPWFKSIGHDSVDLSWTAAIDAAGVGVDRYAVIAHDGLLVGETSGLDLRVSDLAPGSQVAFTIRALDGLGRLSAQSAQLAIRMPGGSGTAPVGPGPLQRFEVSVPAEATEPAAGSVWALRSVTSSGVATVSRTSSLPRSVASGSVLGTVWSLRFSGEQSGEMRVTVPYDSRLPAWRAASLRLLALQDGEWVDAQAATDTVARTVSATLPAAVPFVVVEPDGVDRSSLVSLATTLSSLAPAYGARGTVVVRLADSRGEPLPGRALHLENSTGMRVATFSAVSGFPGMYRAAAPLVRSKTTYRVRFPTDSLNTTVVRDVVIRPKAYLVRKVPTTARPGVRFAVTGTIRPAHTGAAVRVEVQKRGSDGVYRASGHSKTVRTSLTTVRSSLAMPRGAWRVRFVHSDTGHARTVTSWAYIRIP